MSPIRVLIVAEHASPHFGGEAILPLHYFQELRLLGVEAWLIVHERSKSGLDEAIGFSERNRVFYSKDTLAHRCLWFIGRAMPPVIKDVFIRAPMHALTQTMQRKLVKKIVRDMRIDIVHEPIPVSPRQPSMMFGVGAPVLIGPMNGGMTFPPAFRHLESRIERITSRVVKVISPLLNHLIPGKRRAAKLLVANERTRLALPVDLGLTAKIISENGVDLSLWKFTDKSVGGEETREVTYIFIGRLVMLKGIDILIDAFKLVIDSGRLSRLVVIGDGNQAEALQQRVSALGIDHCVTFLGFLSQQECSKQLGDADILVFPSLHDCGGAVVLEAMASGKPVIATNWGGPSDYITQDCGVLIMPSARDQMVNDFADAMIKLADSPIDRKNMGKHGRQRVESEFDWKVKIQHILAVYCQLVSASNGRTIC